MGIRYVMAIGHQLVRCSFQGPPNTVRDPELCAEKEEIPFLFVLCTWSITQKV